MTRIEEFLRLARSLLIDAETLARHERQKVMVTQEEKAAMCERVAEAQCVLHDLIKELN